MIVRNFKDQEPGDDLSMDERDHLQECNWNLFCVFFFLLLLLGVLVEELIFTW